MSALEETAAGAPATGGVLIAWAKRLQLLDERRSDEDEAAYRHATRENNLRNGKLFMLGLTAALLLWWPTDWLVFHGQPNVLSTFARFRPLLALSCLAIFLVLRLSNLGRRLPEVVLGVGGVWLCGLISFGFSRMGGVSMPFFHMLYFCMLGTVAFAAPLRWRVVATWAMGLAVVVMYFGARPEHLDDPFVLTSVNQLFFSAVLSIVAGAISERLRRSNFFLRRELANQAGKLEVRVREQTSELRALTTYNETARENERTHIARELHDELGQELTALRYALSLTSVRYHRDPASIGSNLRELDDLINRTAQTTKNIVLDLRPRVLDDLGLFAAADWLVRRTQERTGLVCEFDGSPCDLPEPVAVAAYRILQESLTNVTRHAEAMRVRVTMGCADGWLTLSIHDDGMGMQAGRKGRSQQPGMGLVGMRERARALGGELSVRSPAEGGTRVEARLPVSTGTGASE